MPPDSRQLLRRPKREAAILAAAEEVGHITEHFQWAGNCTLGQAVVVLMRLEREGLVERGRNGYGMTWRAARR